MRPNYNRQIGLVQQFIFPVAALFIGLIVYSSDPSFPLAAIAALYPLGLLTLVFYPLFFTRGTSMGDIKFAQGARWGTIIVAGISIPIFLILSDVLGNRAVGVGFVTVGFGLTWIPLASAAGLHGYTLANGQNSDWFFDRVNTKPFGFEGLSCLFLALYLGMFGLWVRRWRASLFLVFPIAFYFAGWIFLSVSGGYPGTLLGLVLGVLVPASSALTLWLAIPRARRQKLSELLDRKLPRIVLDNTRIPVRESTSSPPS